MEFRLLGPVEAWNQRRPLSLGGPMQRALLAALLLRPNEAVPIEQLIDDLWDADPPPTARNIIQTYVSRLRTLGGANCDDQWLITRESGYLIHIEPDQLDLNCFERLVADAHRESMRGTWEVAARALGAALRLWRGPALANIKAEPLRRTFGAHLDELYLAAIEQRIEVDLHIGKHAELVGELLELVARHPLRERLRMQLMLALYRAGRQVEALQSYRDLRTLLVNKFGLEPDVSLQRLERLILARDSSIGLPDGSRVVLPEEAETGTAVRTCAKSVPECCRLSTLCPAVFSTWIASRTLAAAQQHARV